ncbi:carbohydrate-binding module family 52 protein [Patellaria atrata CBS 101060]|uniref:Carbohydrate-binding module family 52 protein n=1 Tax=Patellaria atrata CBS 101060 TaxID=1346257 RepID=A0A9P4VND9_9PEZI|nr:carbohydrate-binding module family 52 protein [Patellaria atrata CBS 101060]
MSCTVGWRGSMKQRHLLDRLRTEISIISWNINIAISFPERELSIAFSSSTPIAPLISVMRSVLILIPAFLAVAFGQRTSGTVGDDGQEYCGNVVYDTELYNCFSPDYLCPIVDGLAYLPCGQDCYNPNVYGCFRNSSIYPLTSLASGATLPPRIMETSSIDSQAPTHSFASTTTRRFIWPPPTLSTRVMSTTTRWTFPDEPPVISTHAEIIKTGKIPTFSFGATASPFSTPISILGTYIATVPHPHPGTYELSRSTRAAHTFHHGPTLTTTRFNPFGPWSLIDVYSDKPTSPVIGGTTFVTVTKSNMSIVEVHSTRTIASVWDEE